MDSKCNPDFRNTIRLSAALEEIILLVEDSDMLDADELMDKLNEIIKDYKQSSITDEELRLLEEMDCGDEDIDSM